MANNRPKYFKTFSSFQYILPNCPPIKAVIRIHFLLVCKNSLLTELSSKFDIILKKKRETGKKDFFISA